MFSEVQVAWIPPNSSNTRNQSNCKDRLGQHSSLHGNCRIVKQEEGAALAHVSAPHSSQPAASDSSQDYRADALASILAPGTKNINRYYKSEGFMAGREKHDPSSRRQQTLLGLLL